MDERLILIGDNPFLGISHLSQTRAKERGKKITSPDEAGKLVLLALENGANGFTFTTSECSLSILRIIKDKLSRPIMLYPIVPYAYEYVRLAVTLGGLQGLVKKVGREVLSSRNISAVLAGLDGIVRFSPESFFKAYLFYEVSRIRRSIGKKGEIVSLLLHELVVDMALSLNIDWLFKSFIDFSFKLKIKPGFETRNLCYLVNKFKEWKINFEEIVIETPFNSIGFQMSPSKEAYEEALKELYGSRVIAVSILASGYLKLKEAMEYIVSFPNLAGVAVGVSKEEQTIETFTLLKEGLK